MRPGLANAFLVGFIESIADFGNPIVLGGNFGVLSTEIFFAVVGAQLDQGRAAALALLLLAFALGAFFLQRRVARHAVLHHHVRQGRRRPADAAARPRAPRRAGSRCPGPPSRCVLYGFAFAGGFVQTWGRDYTPTLDHFVKAFAIECAADGLIWAGAAWNSFLTTVKLAAIAAPLTAALGLLAAWLLARQRFAGRAAFEFAHDAAFAIPGTVIGVALHPRLQRAAVRAHRHRADHRALLRVPQHAGRRARRHGGDEPDRPQPRRGLAHAARAAPRRRCARRAAAAQARARRRRWSTASCAR